MNHETNRVYRDEPDALATLLEEKARFHRNLSRTALGRKEFDLAWRQAILARSGAETLQGYIQMLRGDFNAAQRHYRAALALAKGLGDPRNKAETDNDPAQKQPDAAQVAFAKARALFETLTSYFRFE